MFPSWTAHDANRDNRFRTLRRAYTSCGITENGKTPAAARPEFLVFEKGTCRRIGVLVAFASGCGIANRTAGALMRAAAGPYSAFHAGLRVDAGLCSGRARLRIELLVAAARDPALHITLALCAATDLSVG